MLAWRNSDYSLTSKLPSSSAGRSKSRCLASSKASFCAEPSKYATSIMSRSQAVTAQGFPIAWIRARLMRAKTTREAVTATTTRKPAAATTFTSTPQSQRSRRDRRESGRCHRDGLQQCFRDQSHRTQCGDQEETGDEPRYQFEKAVAPALIL